MKKYAGFCICLFLSCMLFAADLDIGMDDVRLARAENGGFDLYIRKKPDIRSVLLTETTKDPAGKADNYAFRDADWNPVNGDELRILDGEILTADKARFSLVDSTPVPDPVFGEAFHIYIPQTIYYGYPWTRSGTVEIHKGMFINVRAFEKVYANYEGAFNDNPFVVDLIPPQEKTAVPVLVDDFRQETVESFSAIAKSGAVLYSRGIEDIVDKIHSLVFPPDPERSLDIVLVIDATESMDNDIHAIRAALSPMLRESLPGYKSFRIGLVLYKDYYDDFNYEQLPVKVFPFTDNLDVFDKSLNNFRVSGGRDIPEAVYEGLYAALTFYFWDSDALQKIILIGDAEPHPKPRGMGKYTKDLIDSLVTEKQIEVNAIILMDEARPNK